MTVYVEVWIVPNSGKVFHRRIGCVPRWHRHDGLSRKDAIRLGFTACQRCRP